MKTILKSIARLSLCFLGMTLLFGAATPANAQRTNFSGTWVQNAEKSESAMGPANFIKSITITQTEKILVMELEKPDKKRHDTLNLDGSPVESVSPSASQSVPLKRTARIKWLDMRSFEILTTDDVINAAGERQILLKGTQTITLSADGKTLTIKGSITSIPDQKEYPFNLLFEK